MPKKYHLHLKGVVGGYDFDADYVDYILSRNADKPVDVLINSLGGSVSSALSISSAFARHGEVSVHFAGMNASAATIASLGAKHISIDSSAMYLVHQCSQTIFRWANMNADDLDAYIKELQKQQIDLQKVDDNISSMYARRCRKDRAELVELMKRGGWLSSQEALDWGFVDEIVEDGKAQAPLTQNIVNDLSKAGIPIPDIPIEAESTFFDRLIKMFSSYKSKPNPMNKIFTLLAALLSVETFSSKDGNITLTEEQMQLIEDELARNNQTIADNAALITERDTQIAERDNQIADLNATIEALKSAPAGSTASVVDDNNGKTSLHDTFVKSCKEAKNLFDSIS